MQAKLTVALGAVALSACLADTGPLEAPPGPGAFAGDAGAAPDVGTAPDSGTTDESCYAQAPGRAHRDVADLADVKPMSAPRLAASGPQFHVFHRQASTDSVLMRSFAGPDERASTVSQLGSGASPLRVLSDDGHVVLLASRDGGSERLSWLVDPIAAGSAVEIDLAPDGQLVLDATVADGIVYVLSGVEVDNGYGLLRVHRHTLDGARIDTKWWVGLAVTAPRILVANGRVRIVYIEATLGPRLLRVAATNIQGGVMHWADGPNCSAFTFHATIVNESAIAIVADCARTVEVSVVQPDGGRVTVAAMERPRSAGPSRIAFDGEALLAAYWAKPDLDEPVIRFFDPSDAAPLSAPLQLSAGAANGDPWSIDVAAVPGGWGVAYSDKGGRAVLHRFDSCATGPLPGQ